MQLLLAAAVAVLAVVVCVLILVVLFRRGEEKERKKRITNKQRQTFFLNKNREVEKKANGQQIKCTLFFCISILGLSFTIIIIVGKVLIKV